MSKKKWLITFLLFLGFLSVKAQTPQMLLELVKADPNPYYDDESSDHLIRINNLPYQPVKVQILIGNQQVIRTFDTDSRGYIDWDLKNGNGELISTGAYWVKVDFEGASRTFQIFAVVGPKKETF